MGIFYSASSGGFYNTSFFDYSLPEDVQEISEEAHAKLMSAQENGLMIISGEGGKPIAVLPQSLLSLEDIKAQKIRDLSAQCANTIVGGFSSAALGDPHVYPSNIKDQVNLMGSVTDSILPDLSPDWETPFWVADPDGVWSFKPHAASQIQQAGRDGKAHVVRCQKILEELTQIVLLSETNEAVSAVVWPLRQP